MTLHAQARAQGQWLSAGELEQATKGGQYALHSQSVQALCQQFAANVATATELRRQELAETGHIQTQYPHHPKAYQTVVWKDQALTILPSGHLRLPTGGQRPPLLLPLPAEYQSANLRRAELTWRADHYELLPDARHRRDRLPPPLRCGAVAGVDLGEVHVAAVTTPRRHALVLSGRQLRACKQWRNKVHSLLQEQLSRCQPGSRRAKRLLKFKTHERQTCTASNAIACIRRRARWWTFCQTEGVSADRGGGCARHPDGRQSGQADEPEDQPVAAWAVRPLPAREGGAAGHQRRVDRRGVFDENL